VLRDVFDEEPRYVDLRWARAEEHLSSRHPRFRDCVADLAVPLHGRDKDELVGEDVRQHRRTVRLARSAVAVLTALALAASGAAVIAVRERNDARTQARLSLSRQLAAQADATRDQQLDLAAAQSGGAPRRADRRGEGQPAGGAEREPGARVVAAEGGSRAAAGGDRSPGSGIVFSPDRRTLAWGTAAGATVFDVPTRRRQQVAAGAGTVVDLAFSPDGRTLALSSMDSVLLWDLSRQRPAGQPLDTHGGLFFRDDGQRLAVAGGGGVSVWDLERRRPTGAPIALSSPGAETSVVAFSRDLRRMATGDSKGTLRLWDVDRRAVIRSRAGHEEPVAALAFDDAGQTLASAGSQGPSVDGIKGSVAVWDVDTLQRKGEQLTSDRGTFANLAFSPDGRDLAASYLTTRGATGIDGSVLLLDPQDLRASGRTLRSLGEEVTGLAFAPGGQWLATIDTANTLEREETVTIWDRQRSGRLRVDVVEHRYVTSSTAISPRGDRLAFTVQDTQPDFERTVSKTFVVRPGRGRRPVQLASGSAAGVPDDDDLAFSHDGRLLAALTSDGPLRLWDVTSRKPLGQPRSGASAVAFHPRQPTMAIGQRDGTTLLWDPEASRSLGVLAPAADGAPASGPARHVRRRRDDPVHGRRLRTARTRSQGEGPGPKLGPSRPAAA
jgi:WD40 repeat protein